MRFFLIFQKFNRYSCPSVLHTVFRNFKLTRNLPVQFFDNIHRLFFTIIPQLTGVLPIVNSIRFKDNKVISGLYAAGNVSGGFFANDYPVLAAGVSHGRCITEGYLAGRHAATSGA